MKIQLNDIEVAMDAPDEMLVISHHDVAGDPDHLYLNQGDVKDLWYTLKMLRDAGYIKFLP